MNFPEKDMKAAFDKVADKENWKRPIDATVTAEELAIIVAAITFYTGFIPKVTPKFGPAWARIENGIEGIIITGYNVKADGCYTDEWDMT